jgi:hypothetical protein
LVAIGFISYQQFQIYQLRQDFQSSQQQTQSDLVSLRNDLTITDQKADTALETLKRTQNRSLLCKISRLFGAPGEVLCAAYEAGQQ